MRAAHTLTLAALVIVPAVFSIAPAVAQQVNPNISANVDPNRVRDSLKLNRDLQCRLGLINPKACLPSSASPSKRR
jgi:hypothetical protein